VSSADDIFRKESRTEDRQQVFSDIISLLKTASVSRLNRMSLLVDQTLARQHKSDFW